MRKISILLSTLVLAAMVLAACGGGATSTNVAGSPPPVTVDVTEDMGGTATESPTDAGAMTETPGVPVTGDVNPARLSNQLDFTVWSQDGEQIGEVNDMVLDMDNTRVAYVVVGTGGFLDLGERDILVPWESLQLQTGSGDTTGGQQNAFILQSDLDTFRNAPDFDLTANVPQMGQAAGEWDGDVRAYWQGGGIGTGTDQATATAGTGGAGTDQATATAGTGGTGTDQATATAGTGATDQSTATAGTGGTGTDQGQGGQATALQGVVLASEVLGSTITSTGQGNEGQGQDQGQATATAGTGGSGTDQATATPGTGGTGADQATATTDPGTGGTGTDQGLGAIDLTIDDMIVDVDAGEIMYLVVSGTFDEGERWIPVPLGLLQWNAGSGVFVLNTNPAVLRDAPSFQNGQFPDTTTSGWNSEFDTYWQNNPGGTAGTDMGAQATATP